MPDETISKSETRSNWRLTEARQRFSELVRRALEEGPQTVTRRGEDVVVVVSAEAFRGLARSIPDFKNFLLSGLDFDQLEIDRSRQRARIPRI